jgi:subtilase family serine protease
MAFFTAALVGAGAASPVVARPAGDLPDLSVVSIGYAYNSDCSSISSINSVFQNSGIADAGQFLVRFDIDGHVLRRFYRPSLAAGAFDHTNPFAIAWSNPIPGTHSITVTLDPGDHVQESNEGNNSLSSMFTCQ